MLKIFSSHDIRPTLVFSLLTLLLLALSAAGVRAQTNFADGHSLLRETSETVKKPTETRPGDNPPVNKKPATTEEKLNALEQMLERQSERLDQLQQTIAEQQETIRLLTGKVNGQPAAATSMDATATTRDGVAPTAAQVPTVEDRLKKVETRVSEIGAIKFSGDIRLRAESFFGLSNSLANGANPLALGNELSPRHRMRLRARLQMRGSLNDEFDWGLRLATGSFADNVSTNQTLTDFFNHKPFALDQAFITYKPKKVSGLRFQGG